MIRLWIPRWQPTRLNQMKGHWSNGHKLKKRDRAVVMYSGCHLPKAEGKRRVMLTIVMKPGQRRADPDAYWKSTLDALVHAGMLMNDSPDWVELAPVQYERSEEWGTWIMLENI